jgi:tRNA (Thr-GGU) A37 N-methylase
MNPEAIKRETTLVHQRAEDHIAVYNRVIDALAGLKSFSTFYLMAQFRIHGPLKLNHWWKMITAIGNF